MNDYLHRLASRVGFRTLGQQLALLFALLLTLSVGGYAVYVGFEQADFIEQLERSHADELTTALAAALEPHVARGEATEIGAHLLLLEGYPRVRQATVTDRQGVPLASVRMTSGNTPRVEPLDRQPLVPPATGRAVASGPHIVAWASIGNNAPLGWLRLELAPASSENLAHILSDSLLAGILTLLGGTLAIRYFLRAQRHSLQQRQARQVAIGRKQAGLGIGQAVNKVLEDVGQHRLGRSKNQKANDAQQKHADVRAYIAQQPQVDTQTRGSLSCVDFLAHEPKSK